MKLFVQPGQDLDPSHPFRDNVQPVEIPPVPPVSDSEHELQRIQSLRDMHPPESLPPLEPVYPKPHFNSYSIDTRRTSTHVGDIDSRLHLGENVQYAEAFFNFGSGHITIGDHAFLGQYTRLLAGTHDYTKTGKARQAAMPGHGYDIVVGNGVWIGTGSTVLGPCIIGDNAVIGAGSVVTSGQYEAGCLYAGNPARLIKRIDLDQI